MMMMMMITAFGAMDVPDATKNIILPIMKIRKRCKNNKNNECILVIFHRLMMMMMMITTAFGAMDVPDATKNIILPIIEIRKR